jgi:hypothetical protein
MNDDQNAPQTPGTPATPDVGNTRPRDGHGKWLRTPADVHKDARAVQLRTQGMTLDQIAAELGYRHAASAWKAVSRALAMVPAASVAEYRELQNRQLDYLTATALEMVMNPAPLVTPGGRIVKHPERGEILEDTAAKSRAIALLLQIAARRARLLGLDAPTKEQFSLEQINQYIRDLEREVRIGEAEFGRFESWCDAQFGEDDDAEGVEE